MQRDMQERVVNVSNHNIRRLKRLAHTLDAAEATVARFFDMVPELMAIISGDRFVKVNPMWKKVLGWDPSRFPGKKWTALLHPDDVAAAKQAQKSNAITGLILRFRKADGKYLPVEWATSGATEDGLVYAIGRLEVCPHCAMKRTRNGRSD